MSVIVVCVRAFFFYFAFLCVREHLFIHTVIIRFILSTNKMTIECLYYAIWGEGVRGSKIARNNFYEKTKQKKYILVTLSVTRMCMKNKYFNSNKMKRVIYITSCPVVCVCVCLSELSLFVYLYYVSMYMRYFSILLHASVSVQKSAYKIKNEMHFIAFYLSKYFDNVYYYFHAIFLYAAARMLSTTLSCPTMIVYGNCVIFLFLLKHYSAEPIYAQSAQR